MLRLRKNVQVQGPEIPKSEAYIGVRRNDEE
jgi:hypothetical protein